MKYVYLHIEYLAGPRRDLCEFGVSGFLRLVGTLLHFVKEWYILSQGMNQGVVWEHQRKAYLALLRVCPRRLNFTLVFFALNSRVNLMSQILGYKEARLCKEVDCR